MPDKPLGNAALVDLVTEILKAHVGQEFTSKELAELIQESSPGWCTKKLQNSKPGINLTSQIASEISSRRPQWLEKFPELQSTETPPRRLSWNLQVDETVNGDEIDPGLPSAVEKVLEADLYPILQHYLMTSPVSHPVYSKRINEKKSSNKLGPKANEWLHPDVVGLESLMDSWIPAIQGCAEHAGDRRARLWSFEVKFRVSRGSVRRDYFQAVSNSSWAHFGYLVAAKVDLDAMSELKMLHGMHGIGLMLLDTENPAESEVLIPARERPYVDWVAANRLAKENKDFMDFTNLVFAYFTTKSINKKYWDIPESYLMGD